MFRLLYIFRLVWETKPVILIGMTLLSIFSGLLPVGQAYAASYLLNELASSFITAQNTGILSDEKWLTVVGLLVLQFAFIFAISLTNNINSLVTRISGELVANHVRTKVMVKAKDLDIESFDKPDFYARLENATREADHRPIQIINSVFTLISTVITIFSYFAVLISVKPVWASALVILLSIPGAVVSFVYKKKNFRYMRHRQRHTHSPSSFLRKRGALPQNLKISRQTDNFFRIGIVSASHVPLYRAKRNKGEALPSFCILHFAFCI